MYNLFGKLEPEKKKHKPDVMWDALVKAFGLRVDTKDEHSRYSKIVKGLKLKKAGADEPWVRTDYGEILARKKRHVEMWPKMTCSPDSMLKHWDILGEKSNAQQIQDSVDRQISARQSQERELRERLEAETGERISYAEHRRRKDANS